MKSLIENFRIRYYILCIIAVIGLFFLIFYSLLPSIDNIWKNEKLTNQVFNLQVNKHKQNQLTSEINLYNRFLYSGSESELQQELFEQISHTCDTFNVQINDFKLLSTKEIGDWTIITNFCSINSGYREIVSTIYSLEKYCLGSKVNSIVFRTLLNRSTKKKELVADLHIQSIVKK